jgi:hypothetical protein
MRFTWLESHEAKVVLQTSAAPTAGTRKTGKTVEFRKSKSEGEIAGCQGRHKRC